MHFTAIYRPDQLDLITRQRAHGHRPNLLNTTGASLVTFRQLTHVNLGIVTPACFILRLLPPCLGDRGRGEALASTGELVALGGHGYSARLRRRIDRRGLHLPRPRPARRDRQLRLGLPVGSIRVARRSCHRFGKLRRLEPVKDSLDHELLQRIGDDRHPAATSEARAARTHITAASVIAGAGIQLRPAMRAAQETSQQIAARGAIRSTVGIAELRPQLLRLRRPDDRRPLRLRNDLAAMLPLTADPTRHQQAAKRLRTPLLPRHRLDTAPVQVRADRAQRRAPRRPAPGASASSWAASPPLTYVAMSTPSSPC
jgi:hypothetical protein